MTPAARQNAAISAWQFFEDGFVEYKDAIDALGQPTGMKEGGLVVDAEVAPKPDQGGVAILGHGVKCAAKRPTVSFGESLACLVGWGGTSGAD